MKRIIACVAALTLSGVASAEWTGENLFIGYKALNWSLMNETVSENKETKAKTTTNDTGLASGQTGEINMQYWTPEYGVDFTVDLGETNYKAVKGYYSVMPNVYVGAGFGLQRNEVKVKSEVKDSESATEVTTTNNALDFIVGGFYREQTETNLIEGFADLTITQFDSEGALSGELSGTQKTEGSRISLNAGGSYYVAMNPKLFVGAGANFSYLLSGNDKITTTPAAGTAQTSETDLSAMRFDVTLASLKAVL